jgi:hypothetical protein
MPLGLASDPTNLPTFNMRPRSSALLCLAVLFLFAGCRDREITTYRAPKDAPPPAAGQMPSGHPPVAGSPAMPGDAATMANTPVPTASGSALTWTAPAHWTAKPLGPMRKGSFALKSADGSAEADLSITAFPGNTGGLEANLNRWRNQLAVPALANEALHSGLEHLDVNGLHIELVEITGTANGAPATILGAILSRPGETWFFKLMGPAPLVAAEKPAFRAFIQTVQEAR